MAEDPSIGNAVQVVGEFLDMDVAHTTSITPSSQIFDTLIADGESFGVAEGMVMDIEDSDCDRVPNGRLPGVRPDVKGIPARQPPNHDRRRGRSLRLRSPATFRRQRPRDAVRGGSREQDLTSFQFK
ncbi:MAG TPA: hypothetical protein VHM66_09860 [Solirubrobacterales bacterium]|nr:hypothetical protein [Solirubrobacterales bacterium]